MSATIAHRALSGPTITSTHTGRIAEPPHLENPSMLVILAMYSEDVDKIIKQTIASLRPFMSRTTDDCQRYTNQ